MAITRQRAQGTGERTLSGLAAFWHSLRRSSTELEAVQVAEHVHDRSSGSTPMSECSIGSPVCVEGLVRTITLHPVTQSPVVEIDLFDGTSSVTVRWLGRRRIAGIGPGRRIVVHGRLAGTELQPVIFNPRYELLPGAE